MEYFESKDDPEWQDYLKTDESGAIYIDLAGFNKSQLQMLGIPESNIDISSIDTFTSEDYFSHSAGEHGGRFAVLAMLR